MPSLETKPALRASRHATGFTLVEILVATAVLAGLLLLIAQLFNSAVLTTLDSRKRVESDAAVRTVMGIMANDFARMIQRPLADVDYVFAKSTGNDKVFFYTEAPGYMPVASLSNKSTVSLIGYRINDKFQLERLGKALTWTGSGTSMVFLSFSGSTPVAKTTLAGAWPTTLGSSPGYNGTDNDYHAVSDEVFRFEFCFLTQSKTSGTAGFCEPSSNWQPWADDNQDGIPNMKDVTAVVVSVAALDKASREIVSDMAKLAAALPDPTDADLKASPPRLPAAIWKQAIESSTFAKTAGAPQLAAGAVRVYQRVYHLGGN